MSQPACGNQEPHTFHNHEWMDHEFKEHSVWCNGICEWCYPFESDLYYPRPHGPGAHK